MSEPTRKLATIVFTDIVGFTKMSAENEPLAIQLLDTQRTTLRPIVDRHGGEWLKEMGDGLLLTFHTTKEAVDCCIEIQHTVKNVANLDLRIGIHQGEVVVQGGDVIGDDVNIASRSEPFAAPGGIVVTDRVNVSLMRDPVYQTKLIGKPALKGVRQEITLYCITSHGLPKTNLSQVSAKLEGGQSTIEKESDTIAAPLAQTIQAPKQSSSKMPMIIGGVVVVLGVIAGMIFMGGREDNASVSSSSEKESIAVLPFVNMSSDQENEYFSDGITEEILNYLAKIKDLRVISRTSVFTYKGRSDISLAEIGKQLDVTHVLEGSVRKSGNKVRITAQLIRANDDAHLWSETYDRELKDIFVLQDDIARTIVNALKMDYISHEDAPIAPKKDMSIEAFNAYMQGRHFWNQRSKDGLQKAIKFFKQTLSKDPEYDLAYVGIATSYGLMADYNYMPRDEALALAGINIEKALSLDPNTAEVNTGVAYLNWMENKNPELIESYFKKAIQINPNYSTANHWLSDFLGNVEREFGEAVKYAEKAYRLDPMSPIIVGNLANAYMRAGMFEKTEKTLIQSLDVNPNFYRSTSFLSIVYRRTGRWEEAERILEKFLNQNPNELQGWNDYATVHIGRGNYSKGIETIKNIYDLIGPSNPIGFEFDALIHFLGNEPDKAGDLADQALSIAPDVPIGNLIKGCVDGMNGNLSDADEAFKKAYTRFKGLWMDFECMTLGYQGIVHALHHDEIGAKEIIEMMIAAGPAPERDNFIGMIYLYLGEKEKGWNLLSSNMKNNGCYLFLKCDPFLQKFKNDPEYKRLLKKYNLDERPIS